MTDHSFSNRPFFLSPEDLAWVEARLSALSDDDKLRQLFNLMSRGGAPESDALIRAFRPGSITRMGGPGSFEAEAVLIADLGADMPTPLLVSADIEGARMSLAGGAQWPNPLALAAIDDLDTTREVSVAMAREARACGINWSFTPVLDINAAWRSAIVATRGFGADPATIARHALCQMTAFQENGIAATLKHWPGEGYDDRDQHLLTTINPLDMDAWDATFGALYRRAIEMGAMSVMSAHIALPAFARAQGASGVEPFRPASISRALTHDLLRGQLGFDGLVVSDASSMAGLGSWAPRREYLPDLVAAGCDVILFSENPEQDLGYLYAALQDGRLGFERVNDAVRRQLAMKAAMGLGRIKESPAPPSRTKTTALAAQTARRAPTLVKDVAQTLPLTPARYARVLIYSSGITVPFVPDPLPFALPDLLAGAGFEVTMFEAGMDVTPARFDLVLYLLGDETLLTRGHIFLDWLKLSGDFMGAMQRNWHDIPTVMISFGYPYMLYDAPRVPTYINAYCTTETMQSAVLDLLLGKVPWNPNSPVDPFCGLEDARF